MTINEIMDKYAMDSGYIDWEDFKANNEITDRVISEIAVLSQRELSKNISDAFDNRRMNHIIFNEFLLIK